MKKQSYLFATALVSLLAFSSCGSNGDQCQSNCEKACSKEACENVCSKKACEKIPVKEYTSAKLYMTSKDSDLRISEVDVKVEDGQDFAPMFFTYVDPTHQFQKMVGIGGAITDAVSINFSELSPELQEEFLNAYFDKEKGIGYTMIRTHINSCDFGPESYTYVEDNDSTLSTFDISHDKELRLPLIKKAMEKSNNTISLLLSAWSAPAWMKDNNSRVQGGHILPECNQMWSDYIVKYIKEVENYGVPVWGLTAQNEPQATQTWESCIFSAEEQRDYVKNYLGPTLWNNGMKDKKLIIFDHNRDIMFHYALTVLNDPEAAKYVWGTGAHWYETWRDYVVGSEAGMNFAAARGVKEAFPDKELAFTEGCVEGFSWEKANDWGFGEKYAYSILNDLNCGTSSWTDWNILLNHYGGPTWIKNFCLAPVHMTEDKKLVYTNAYYYIGHFSKFIQPGARRVSSCSDRSDFETTAFINTDGSLSVVALNRKDYAMDFAIVVGNKSYKARLNPHSIATLVLK